LPGAPEDTRRPTVVAQVANFGLSQARRSQYQREVPESVLGRVLYGFKEDGPVPWITFQPKIVPIVRVDVLRALQVATAATATDEYADWYASQLRKVDRVFARAAEHREWVVSLFEGDYGCFLRGGVADGPGEDMFAPHCTMAPPPRSRAIPLGVAAVLVTGLAIAGWRHRRFLAR